MSKPLVVIRTTMFFAAWTNLSDMERNQLRRTSCLEDDQIRSCRAFPMQQICLRYYIPYVKYRVRMRHTDVVEQQPVIQCYAEMELLPHFFKDKDSCKRFERLWHHWTTDSNSTGIRSNPFQHSLDRGYSEFTLPIVVPHSSFFTRLFNHTLSSLPAVPPSKWFRESRSLTARAGRNPNLNEFLQVHESCSVDQFLFIVRPTETKPFLRSDANATKRQRDDADESSASPKRVRSTRHSPRVVPSVPSVANPLLRMLTPATRSLFPPPLSTPGVHHVFCPFQLQLHTRVCAARRGGIIGGDPCSYKTENMYNYVNIKCGNEAEPTLFITSREDLLLNSRCTDSAEVRAVLEKKSSRLVLVDAQDIAAHNAKGLAFRTFLLRTCSWHRIVVDNADHVLFSMRRIMTLMKNASTTILWLIMTHPLRPVIREQAHLSTLFHLDRAFQFEQAWSKDMFAPLHQALYRQCGVFLTEYRPTRLVETWKVGYGEWDMYAQSRVMFRHATRWQKSDPRLRQVYQLTLDEHNHVVRDSASVRKQMIHLSEGERAQSDLVFDMPELNSIAVRPNEQQELQCRICLCVPDNPVWNSTCDPTHVFCYACLDHWTLVTPSCPLCRNAFDRPFARIASSHSDMKDDEEEEPVLAHPMMFVETDEYLFKLFSKMVNRWDPPYYRPFPIVLFSNNLSRIKLYHKMWRQIDKNTKSNLGIVAVTENRPVSDDEWSHVVESDVCILPCSLMRRIRKLKRLRSAMLLECDVTNRQTMQLFFNGFTTISRIVVMHQHSFLEQAYLMYRNQILPMRPSTILLPSLSHQEWIDRLAR